MTTEAPIRTLIVDDSAAFRRIAEDFLSSQPDIEVVGSAQSGEEAVSEVERLHPDLVVMDLAMPGMNGFQATRKIKSRPDAPRVIILTLHNLPAYRTMSKMVGADGFVIKDDFGIQFLQVVHTLFPS